MSDSTLPLSPCLQCGACCAALRVAFHWSEADDVTPGGVPRDLTVPLRAHERCMRGTEHHPTRCVALEGNVGQSVRCSIYLQRPSPCRDLHWHGENGKASEQCTRARAAHGLPPLAWPEMSDAGESGAMDVPDGTGKCGSDAADTR